MEDRSNINRTIQNSAVQKSAQKICVTRYDCYLVSFLVFLFSIMPKNIAGIGLFVLLFTPLTVFKKLNLSIKGLSIILLVLALAGAIGILAADSTTVRLFCFCFSSVMWCMFLSSCVYSDPDKSITKLCVFTLAVMILNICQFFSFDNEEDKKKFNAVFVRIIFNLIVIFSFLIILLCLILQADIRIYDIIYTIGNLAIEKIMIISACIVLAFFLAAFIYGVVYSLTDMPIYISIAKTQKQWDDIIPWGRCFAILIAINCVFVIIELYYSALFMEMPQKTDYNFYSILAVFVLVFIGLFLMASKAALIKAHSQILYAALGLSDIGVILVAGYRIYYYVYYFGLWEDRIFLFVLLLASSMILCATLFFVGNNPSFFYKGAVRAMVLLLLVILILPKDFIISEINVSVFLHKYSLEQLENQKTNTSNLIEISENDLNLKQMELYGIDAVPAWERLLEIDDVFVEGQPLNNYAKTVIVSCVCEDLHIEQGRDMEKNISSVLNKAERTPRYRFPSKYSTALSVIERMEKLSDN